MPTSPPSPALSPSRIRSKIRYFERRLSKVLKNLTLFSLLKEQSLFRLHSTFKKIPLLAMYYLTEFDHIICKGLWVIAKTKSTYSWHHKLFLFHLPIWIWKMWKAKEKITKIWISRERKELFRWNKKYLKFLKGYHSVKKKK